MSMSKQLGILTFFYNRAIFLPNVEKSPWQLLAESAAKIKPKFPQTTLEKNPVFC